MMRYEVSDSMTKNWKEFTASLNGKRVNKKITIFFRIISLKVLVNYLTFNGNI